MTNNGFKIGFFSEILLQGILKKTNLQHQLNNGGVKCVMCDCNVTLDNLGSLARVNGSFKPICERTECISNVQRKLLE